MSTVNHLAVRQLSVGSSGGGGISATSIGLIVGLGIVPVIILVYVVSWLFWCYPYDRSCCCTRRKKKPTDEEVMDAPDGIEGHAIPRDGTISSGETLHEKRTDVPERPYKNGRPYVGYRTESGSSSAMHSSNRLTKADPSRMSVQTVDTTYTGRTNQEPKRFV